MRVEDNTTSGPPMRERFALTVGFESSTHDASRLGWRESPRGVASRVTHAFSEFVARRDTSPCRFGSRVAIRDTPDRQSEQSRGHQPRQKLRGRLMAQPPKETKYA